MSVPPTPGFPGETPPTSGAPNSNDPTVDGNTAQPTSPGSMPRETPRPHIETPPHAPTYPPQPFAPPAPTQPPVPQQQTRTQPPVPQQQTPTQPPGPAPYHAQAQSVLLPPSLTSNSVPTLVSHRRRQPRRWQPIALGIVVVLLLATIGVGGFGIYAAHEAQQPTLAAQSFCRDVQAKQYTAAYQMLSSTYQAKTSQAQFVEEAGLHDQVDGPVAACAVLQSSAPQGYTLRLIDSATLALRITRHKPLDGSIRVIKEGSDWKVDSIATALQGTDLAPLFVGFTFCKALVAKDYVAAYNTFSSHQRSGGSESAFAATFVKAFGANLQITKCVPTIPSYVVAPKGASATVDVALQITLHVQGNAQVTIPAAFTFVSESGEWKLDSIAVKSA